MPPFASVCAALVADPWNLPLSEIAKLTDYQIYEVYFHKRDEKGELEIPLPTPKDDYEILMQYGAILGIPQEELQNVWDNRPRE